MASLLRQDVKLLYTLTCSGSPFTEVWCLVSYYCSSFNFWLFIYLLIYLFYYKMKKNIRTKSFLNVEKCNNLVTSTILLQLKYICLLFSIYNEHLNLFYQSAYTNSRKQFPGSLVKCPFCYLFNNNNNNNNNLLNVHLC